MTKIHASVSLGWLVGVCNFGLHPKKIFFIVASVSQIFLRGTVESFSIFAGVQCVCGQQQRYLAGLSGPRPTTPAFRFLANQSQDLASTSSSALARHVRDALLRKASRGHGHYTSKALK